MPKRVTWLVEHATPVLADLVAAGAGALLNLAFAPHNQWWLPPLCLAVLYRLWQYGTPARAAWRGLLFSFALFAIGVSWVERTLAEFGSMPEAAAVVATFLFVMILAAYTAGAGFIFARLRGSSLRDPWLFAALWTLMEWVRGVFLTGFPWLDVGYSATHGPLLVWAPWCGALGISFLLALAGALLGELRRQWVVALGLLLLMAALTPLLAQVRWVHRAGSPLTVSLIQGDVSPTIKWDPRNRAAILRHYLRLTRASDGRVVIWPETAVPGFSRQLRHHFIPMMQRQARQGHRHFLFGLVEGNEYAAHAPIYNAVLSIGRHDGYYRKRHLVPFGEYLPWPSLFDPILAILHIPMSGFTPWHGREPALPVAGARIGLTICYEIAYGDLVTQALPAATLLVNVSDDSWYGHSDEARQQFQIARVRAAEADRDLLIDTNDGITALVTNTGEVAARLPPFRPADLTVVAQPYTGLTPYDRYGHTPVLIMAAILVLGAVIGRIRTRRAYT